MATITFDTLEFDKKLLAAGFTAKQAETLTHELAKIIDDGMVTKDYLNTKFSEVDIRLATLKTELIRWVLGTTISLAGIMIAFISMLKFLH